MLTNVLIAGGGPHALEAPLALHRSVGDRVATTALTPASVLSPFAARAPMTYLQPH